MFIALIVAFINTEILQETIHRIGHAYDNLHHELQGLAKIADKNQSPEVTTEREPATPQSKKNQFSNNNHHVIPVELLKKTKDHTTLNVPLLIDKTIQHFIPDNMMKNKTTHVHEKRKTCDGKNMSTITRYPPKSTGVGLDNEKCKTICPTEEYCKYRKTSTGVHQCCKDFECYNPIYNWKF